jgi:hypothetical protein
VLLVAIDPTREGHEQHLQGVDIGRHGPTVPCLTPVRVPSRARPSIRTLRACYPIGAPKDDCRVRGVRVITKVTYCEHTIQVVAELNREGRWIGRGIVVGRAFEGILPLTAALPTPTAALDATLAAGRRRVDERRGGHDH